MSKKLDLTGKVAFVTGGTRGIGWACAQVLATAGASVALCASSDVALAEEKALSLEQQFSVKCLGLQCDVSNASQVKSAYMQIKKQLGGLDILVNNAGIMATSPLAMTTPDVFDATTSINVNGVLLNLQMASKLMARRGGGSVINISSIVGRFGSPGQIAYSGSKAAVIGITQAASKELAAQGIRVNAVAPGFIDTELLQDFPEDKKSAVVETIALQRIGQAEDVANAVLYLASDLSAYVTGQILGVDGGMVI